MKIRKIKEKDISKCLEIYNYYIENTCYTLEEDKLNLDDFSKRVHGIIQKYPYIVMENDAKDIVGYAYLDVFNSRSAYKKTADLSIYVSKDHLRKHIGIYLLEEIQKIAINNGITNIISIVTSENKNSFDFHLRNGFLLEGTIHDVAIKFGKTISVYYFRKQLN